MAGSGDQVERESADAMLSTAATSSAEDRRRLSALETMACSGQVAQHESAHKKQCIRGVGEALEQGDAAAKGLPWRRRPGDNTAGDDDTAAYAEKYNRYYAEYVCRLKAKYFSKKTLNGGNIFDQETNIDGENIKSSRWPCTRSFTEPLQCLQESSALPSVTDVTTLPGRKHNLKKSS